MPDKTVLIVEDDCIIAADVAQAVTAAGYKVVGMATSEAEALELGAAAQPLFAIVDITLSPGDGRKVARSLALHNTAVLFATSQCSDVETRAESGAVACLPKPYCADWIGAALAAVASIVGGEDPGALPGRMFRLN